MKPSPCAKAPATFDAQVYTQTGAFWFSHALVKRGYHASGIAAEELLRDPKSDGVAFRMVVKPATDCTINEHIWSSDRPANFKRISGHGWVDKASNAFVVDCVCSVEATDYEDLNNRFALYY